MMALTAHTINVQQVLESVGDPGHGATLLFLGVARDHFGGRPVEQLEYESYEEMAVPAMQAIADEISRRWPGTHTSIVHRTGVLGIGDVAVAIATRTPHRAECYEANRHAIEELKRLVPIWKKEVYKDGAAWKENQSG